jgi:hypothetical protein
VERSSGAAPPRPLAAGGDTLLRLHVEPEGDRVAVVELKGELDLGAAPRVEACLREQLGQVERVLQLTGVDKALPLFGDRAAALAKTLSA